MWRLVDQFWTHHVLPCGIIMSSMFEIISQHHVITCHDRLVSYHINLHCTQYHFVMISHHNIPAPSFFSGCQENPTKGCEKLTLPPLNEGTIWHPNWKVQVFTLKKCPETAALIRSQKRQPCAWPRRQVAYPVKLHNGSHFCLKVVNFQDSGYVNWKIGSFQPSIFRGYVNFQGGNDNRWWVY